MTAQHFRHLRFRASGHPVEPEVESFFLRGNQIVARLGSPITLDLVRFYKALGGRSENATKSGNGLKEKRFTAPTNGKT